MAQQVETLEMDCQEMMRKAGPYPLEAFQFVRDGLNFTVQREHDNVEQLQEEQRHINGQQLCIGLRDYAIDQYGLMAPAVLEHWNVQRTDDFGRIVFAMIEAGLMSKTDEDTLDDFRGIFDFHEAFSEDQLIHHICRN